MAGKQGLKAMGLSTLGFGVMLTMTTATLGQAEAPPRPAMVTEAPPRQEGTVRLATYNLLNLFDAHDDLSLVGDNDDCNSYDKTVRAKPKAELEAVARAIRALNADVLAVQEIESILALAEFNAVYLKGMGYEHVVSIDVGHERGIEQAVLSRFPVTEARVWPHMPLEGTHPATVGTYRIREVGQPIAFSRSPLFVRVQVPEGFNEKQTTPYDLALLVVHHKSGSSYGYWREEEAQGLVGRINEMQKAEPELNIAVLGDFNAQPEDDSVRAYLSAGFRDMVTPSVGREAFYTHESRRAIDLVLMNPAFAAEALGPGFVLMTPLRGADEDFRTTPSPEGFASDHMPVAVDLVPINR